MKRSARLVILIACFVLFFSLTPVIIAYSLGYRVDFEHRKLVATGGIFARSFPSADQVIIDSKIFEKPGFMVNSTFTQNLLPKQHSVLIQKEGYADYVKLLPVTEGQVTKLENVILFKNKIIFAPLLETAASPFDKKPAAAKKLPIKNYVAFEETSNQFLYLGADGFFYSSNLEGNEIKKITLSAFKTNKKNTYQIYQINQYVFLRENKTLYLLNDKTQEFEPFYQNIKDLAVSPDNKQVIYFNDYEVFISQLNDSPLKIMPLNRFAEKISQAQWINNDYIILVSGNKIKIAETDIRGNVNILDIAEYKNPQIIFNAGEKKLYVQSEKQVLVSEKILP